MNPLVQDMKHRIAAGEIGRPVLVHGSYLQDWLLYDTDYNWRCEEEVGGTSRAVADIGSHWIDSVQTVVGSRIIEVCANLKTAHPIRKKPLHKTETFTISDSTETEDKHIATEDYAGVLINFENGATGVFQCSQVSAGRKGFLNFEVNGEKASFYWNQERADEMWIGRRDTNNEIVLRNPNFMRPEGRPYFGLATGHPEGWNDAMRNNVLALYNFIMEGKKHSTHQADFATFDDAHHIMKVTEAILLSAKDRKWIGV
jgi:predicted dehydrogenase